jgi:hypothetical protein
MMDAAQIPVHAPEFGYNDRFTAVVLKDEVE